MHNDKIKINTIAYSLAVSITLSKGINMNTLTSTLVKMALVSSLAFSASSYAAVVSDSTPVDFTGGSTSFSFNGASFTLSDNTGGGFSFSPVSIATQGNAAVNSLSLFGPTVPTSYFDPVRGSGVLVFDSSYQYTSFPTATTIDYSAGATFIGLRVSQNNDFYYGYAQFQGTLLKSYGFESTANSGIQAGAISAVPEPESYAMLLAGLGVIGFSLSKKRLIALNK